MRILEKIKSELNKINTLYGLADYMNEVTDYSVTNGLIINKLLRKIKQDDLYVFGLTEDEFNEIGKKECVEKKYFLFEQTATGTRYYLYGKSKYSTSVKPYNDKIKMYFTEEGAIALRNELNEKEKKDKTSIWCIGKEDD